MKWATHVNRIRDETGQETRCPESGQKMRRSEDLECNGRIALRETWNEVEEIGE